MFGMAGRPRLLHKKKQLGRPAESSNSDLGDAVRVLLATSQIRFYRKLTLSSDSLSHFDPFGTEFCEPGRVDHPMFASCQSPVVSCN